MSKVDWKRFATSLLRNEKVARQYCQPEPIGVTVGWRNGIYIGHIQIIVPDYSPEIVSLSKSSKPLQTGMINAIRELDPERLQLIADEHLDLTGRNHTLRKVDNRLTYLTPEQTAYMVDHKPLVFEIDPPICD